MKVSLIIPTYNEERTIGKLIDYLQNVERYSDVELVVVDGGSVDRTVEIVMSKSVEIKFSAEKGRANQMNYGAMVAKGDVLYFVHADTLPPLTFVNCIESAISKGFTSGCCAYDFDSRSLLLRLNSFLTRFNGIMTGGGDQTLFVTREEFIKNNGFNPEFIIMEDFEFTKRLKKTMRFKLLESKAIVSARKFENNSYFRVNVAYIIAMTMFYFRIDPKKIFSTYKSIIR